MSRIGNGWRVPRITDWVELRRYPHEFVGDVLRVHIGDCVGENTSDNFEINLNIPVPNGMNWYMCSDSSHVVMQLSGRGMYPFETNSGKLHVLLRLVRDAD